jgi:hypothetical protein
MAASLLPLPRLWALDAGISLPGALLETYESASSTPLATYSDGNLSVLNANPVVADANGLFPAIYLQPKAYKVILKTAAGATVYSQDPVIPSSLAAVNAVSNGVCNGRITLTSNTPIPSADVTAATTVYWSPYQGNRIALYDGAQWSVYSFSQLSLALGVDAADTNYDLFAYINSGAVAIERLAWTNATTRATGLTLQDGVLVKSGAATRRYLGTYRTTSAAGQCEDSVTKRFVWNYYNRTLRTLLKSEGTNSWTYTTANYQQANASTANQVALVVGYAEVQLNLEIIAFASNTDVNVNVAVAVGEDSTTATFSEPIGLGAQTAVANRIVRVHARQILRYPSIGYHYYAWLEKSDTTGTTTWYGDNGGSFYQAGILGTIEG